MPISPLGEYIILLVIGRIAFCIAWDASPGGRGGSEIHWSVRIIAFTAIWAVVYALIAVVKFVIVHWIPIVCIIGGLIIIAAIIVTIHRIKTKRKNELNKAEEH